MVGKKSDEWRSVFFMNNGSQFLSKCPELSLFEIMPEMIALNRHPMWYKPPIEKKIRETHPFVSESMLRPFTHTLTISENPKQAVWKPSPVTSAGLFSIPTANMKGFHSADGCSKQVGFASPYISEPFCTEIDCPLGTCTHYKGFYFQDATLSRVLNWHKDFGWSDPPPLLLVAYCRFTEDFDAIIDNDTAKEIFIDNLQPDMSLDADERDEKIVKAFLKYHAVTLVNVRRGEKIFAPLRGEVSKKDDPILVMRPKKL